MFPWHWWPHILPLIFVIRKDATTFSCSWKSKCWIFLHIRHPWLLGTYCLIWVCISVCHGFFTLYMIFFPFMLTYTINIAVVYVMCKQLPQCWVGHLIFSLLYIVHCLDVCPISTEQYCRIRGAFLPFLQSSFTVEWLFFQNRMYGFLTSTACFSCFSSPIKVTCTCHICDVISPCRYWRRNTCKWTERLKGSTRSAQKESTKRSSLRYVWKDSNDVDSTTV